MSKLKASQYWRYLAGVLIGVVIVVGLIPSCGVLSSSKFDALVADSRESTINETLSFEEIVANLPTAEKIRAMPIAPHPRLLASEARFAEIKEQIETDATMKEWYEKLHKHADTLLREDLPIYELPDGKRLTNRIHSQVTTLALLYRIEKDPRYLNRVWQELKAAANFPDWNPPHFLDTAEMTYAFAVGYDWLYPYWNEQQRILISSVIIEKGLKPALREYRVRTRWTTAEHNWNQVCNGGIATGALAVMDSYPQLASQILYNSLQRLPRAMQHYAPDGAWNEGIGYWHYGTFYNTVILAALEMSLGNDFDLSSMTGFAQTGLFPIYMNGTTNIPFNFADGDDEFVRAPELLWMSQRFNRPEYNSYQQKTSAHGPLDIIWYKPLKNKKVVQKLPRDRYFRDVEVVSMRSDWEDPDGIFVGFKGGDNRANHSNLDLGTFAIDALGVRWATELGRDNYNLPGYFDPQQRWTYYKTRAEGQNTLVINPSQNPDQNLQAKAKIIHFESHPDRVDAIVDLTPAYYPKVDKAIRKISLQDRRKRVLIEDQIESDIPVNLLWFMHTEAEIQIGKDDRTALLSQHGKQLLVKLLNSKYKFRVMNAEALPSSPNPDGQSKPQLKKLTIELNGVKNEQLGVLFVPISQRGKTTK